MFHRCVLGAEHNSLLTRRLSGVTNCAGRSKTRPVLSVKGHWDLNCSVVLVGQFKLQAPGFI